MKKTILLLLFPIMSFAQEEQSIWYFGDKAGMDFTNSAATVLNGGSMTTVGGGATMADAFGNLLFYTDGINVWNKNHQLMANGTGLKGNPEASQTVLIVPSPLYRYKYYIFTTDARKDNTPNILRYSEVDMALQNGLGEVVKKNISLLEDVSDKITATLHADNQNFWLLTHTWNTRDFYAFKIDSSGISSTPVISKIGSVYSGSTTTGRGSFRLNNFYDGNNVVITLPDLQIFELLTFDNTRGVFHSFVNLSQLSERAAYADFSTFTRFYTVSTKGDEIFEFDSNGASENRTPSTSRSIARGSDFGDLRLARDGLIYVVSSNTNSLHTINYNSTLDNPYYSKPAKFIANAISLGGNRNLEGLPNTIANYTKIWWGWGKHGTCFGDSITYLPHFPNSIDSIKWDFDDLASGSNNYSNELQPTHLFSTPGRVYNIKCTIYTRGRIQQGNLSFDASYSPDLGPDTTFCFAPNQELVLEPNISGANSYKWQDGSTGPTYTVTKPGIYWLETKSTLGNCIYRDSVEVKPLPIPQVNLGNDTTICVPENLLLKARNEGANYLWQDSSTNSTFKVSEPGLYNIKVTNNFGCSATDSIRVYYLTPPAIELGNDTTICAGADLLLDATLPGVTYKWQDGSTGSTFRVTKAGTYALDASIDICSAHDYIVVNERQGCKGDIFVPNVITPNGDGKNDSFVVLDPDKENIWQLEVYNRLGKRVYVTKQYNNQWEANGLSTGVYFYILVDSNNRILKGYIEVLR